MTTVILPTKLYGSKLEITLTIVILTIEQPESI